MTDDESRRAFEDWMNAAPYLPQANEAVWQAAAEWATKRERERCVKIARKRAKDVLGALEIFYENTEITLWASDLEDGDK